MSMPYSAPLSRYGPVKFMFAYAVPFFLASFTPVTASESPTSYFTELCKSKDFSITNPQLPESLGERSSCGLVVKADGTYQSFAMEVRSEPCETVSYKLPIGKFDGQYVRKCGQDVYKVTDTPNKSEKGSIPFWSTFSNESDPSYITVVLCKRGNVVGRYVEIAESLSDKDIRDLKKIYGIDVNPDEIDECLEKAGACA